MKKLLVILLILLTACTSREDFYELSIDDYSITVGYDTGEYLDLTFDYDIKEELSENEVVKDVNIYLMNDLLGVAEFTNQNKKAKPYKECVLTKLTLYVNDLGGRVFKLNGEQLDDSIENNCNKYQGTYIKKNGYACVIETNNKGKHNVVELYGDYLNIDQDKLDHIVIYVD